MEQKLKQLQTEAISKVDVATDLKELNDIRVAYLGKKGPITEVLRGWENFLQKSVRKWESWLMK